MKIKMLSENTAITPEYLSEHGLSIYIDSDKKILFDTGASKNFAINAQKMGVDLSEVEYVFLSHGHYDHCGGVQEFLKQNDKAKVYVDNFAFVDKYSDRLNNSQKEYIGVNPTFFLDNRRVVLRKNKVVVDKDIISFRTTQSKNALPIANKTLYRKAGKRIKNDDFRDERSLLIKEGDKVFLFAGCAHRGIFNIIQQAKKIIARYPDYVIGGFHLHGTITSESKDSIQDLGKKLLATNIKFFTCHCTGLEEYQIIKEILGDNITYASCGMQLNL